MSLVKWEPMRELARLRDEMDRVFARTMEETFPQANGAWMPSVDVQEQNGTLVVKADLPGIKREDVEITATEDALTITGHTEEEEEKKQEGYYRRERRSGAFLRTIPLPVPVDADKAEAVFKHGMVTVTLPKAAVKPTGKKVEVK
jgi:HSP20 family protein